MSNNKKGDIAIIFECPMKNKTLKGPRGDVNARVALTYDRGKPIDCSRTILYEWRPATEAGWHFKYAVEHWPNHQDLNVRALGEEVEDFIAEGDLQDDVIKPTFVDPT